MNEYDDEQAPWWAWGFVAALPLSLLALVTPWFGAVAPQHPDVTSSYSAWTNPWFGVFAPLSLSLAAGRWWGALRGRWTPPAPRGWLGVQQRSGYTAPSYVPSGVASGGTQRPAPIVREPMRTGAGVSLLYGAAALALLGINRALFQPKYEAFTLDFSYSREGNMSVHVAFGCWCLLLACGLFVVTGVLGLLLPERRRTPAPQQGTALWEASRQDAVRRNAPPNDASAQAPEQGTSTPADPEEGTG